MIETMLRHYPISREIGSPLTSTADACRSLTQADLAEVFSYSFSLSLGLKLASSQPVGDDAGSPHSSALLNSTEPVISEKHVGKILQQ